MKSVTDTDVYSLYITLCVASPKERENIVKQADLNIKDNDGKTALVLAAERGRKDIVDSLIEAKADLNIKDNAGRTALMFATKYGQTAIVDSLIKAGADKDITDNNGCKALMYAAEGGQKDIVDLLQQEDKLSEAEQKNC